uniref:(northern house mosquito) hypothetical protein n=1 Tax=Culex pipiens TaxID=7175 RepID=A0A8D8B791_CULPI
MYREYGLIGLGVSGTTSSAACAIRWISLRKSSGAIKDPYLDHADRASAGIAGVVTADGMQLSMEDRAGDNSGSGPSSITSSSSMNVEYGPTGWRMSGTSVTGAGVQRISSIVSSSGTIND